MNSPHTLIVDFGAAQLNDADTEAHFAFVGTTGSGKTVLMRLLQQTVLYLVGSNVQMRALVYDAKHDAMPMLSSYVDRDRLFTMDPFDARGVAWDIAADVTEPRIALELTYTLIPEQSESQPYFNNAGRHLTYAVILSFMLRGLDWTLGDVLRALGSAKLCRRVLYQHEYTARVIEKYFGDKRLLNDIFSTIATRMLLYEPIAGCWEAAAERVALTRWIDDEYVLILGNSEITRTAIDNINRCLFKFAANLLLAKREGAVDRTWFFVDEVSEAGKLTSLKSLLKKGRSKGGRVALAFQSVSGLRDPNVYGQFETDDLLGQIGNRYFGRIECPETAEYASRIIGEHEREQISHSATYSANGGSSTFNTSQVVNRAVLPSEFMSLGPCDMRHGLSGMFTTRSTRPFWDTILPNDLFGGLIPPADDVPNFVPRDPMNQLILPWTVAQSELFAPRITQSTRPQRFIQQELAAESPEIETTQLDVGALPSDIEHELDF